MRSCRAISERPAGAAAQPVTLSIRTGAGNSANGCRECLLSGGRDAQVRQRTLGRRIVHPIEHAGRLAQRQCDLPRPPPPTAPPSASRKGACTRCRPANCAAVASRARAARTLPARNAFRAAASYTRASGVPSISSGYCRRICRSACIAMRGRLLASYFSAARLNAAMALAGNPGNHPPTASVHPGYRASSARALDRPRNSSSRRAAASHGMVLHPPARRITPASKAHVCRSMRTMLPRRQPCREQE